MQTLSQQIKYAVLIGLFVSTSGCIVQQPRYHDGYYDHEHARYWQGGGWHPCSEHGEYCR
jgi:hypothetical protein